MAGLLDFLGMQSGQGGGLLGFGDNQLTSAFGGNQGMLLSGLGLAGGATPGEGFKNMMPALQSAFEQQNAQRAGMAMMNALPGGNQPPQQPSSFGAIGPGASYSNAIAGIESKGQQNPYAAVGPETGKGKAYGKYQVMDFNIPTWTKEVLGQEMTPQQFVASPEAQEAVFKAKFGQYVQKAGNPQDAASMWFTGKPLAEGANRSDVNGMTGQNYVNKFTQNLGQPAPTQQPPPGSPMTNQPGAGLQLVDSPALQGMPDTVRRAIPLMLQSKTMAPQAMTLIQKYINPDQWQMWRDNMGNVFTRNSATGESKPLLTPTPDMMNANASGLKSPLEYQAATQLTGSAAKNTELTPEQKNTMPIRGGSMNAAAAGAEAKGVGDALAEQWKTISNKGLSAGKTMTTLQRMSQLSDDAFQGAAAPALQTARSFLTSFGIPSETVTKGQEFTALSNKLVMDALNGSLGAGVSNADVSFISNINPNLAHTVPARREIIETLTSLAKRDQVIAKMAGEYRRQNGSLDGFDVVASQYGEANPLFAGRKNVAEPKQTQVQDGATATNKQTGQQIIFRGGKWQPVGPSL